MASELEKLDNALKNVNNAVATYAAAKEAKKRDEYNTQVLDMTKDMQAWSQDFNERQFSKSLEQWDKSFEFNLGAANLAQENFENATQIRARDMQQVGLNPLNLVGGAEGSSANFMSGSSPAGSASSPSASPVAPLSIADLFARFASMRHDSIENKKNRKSAENVASIQAKAAKDVAQINADASKYGSDLGYSSSSESNDIARLKVINDKEVRDAELLEKKYEFDTNLEKDVRQFNANVDIEYNKLRLGLYETNSANARTLATLSTEQFKAALNAYTTSIHNSMEFALSINRLKLDYDKFIYAQEKDKKELALKNTQIALDNATKQMQAITGLVGDICKSFIIGILSSGR